MTPIRRCPPLLLLLGSLALQWGASPASAQLTPLGARLLEECAAAGSCDTNDAFGSALATGDFDNDGFLDLAVGVPGEEIGGDAQSGAVHIFRGSSAGLLLTGDQIFHQGTEGIADTADPGDHFGHALAAADFNADGFDDLAISAPDEDESGLEDIGAVWVLFGSETGLIAAGSLFFGQGSISDVESSEAGDRFGASLAAGRIDQGSRADLVIGVPGEDFIPILEDDVGVIHILYNSGSTPLAREQRKTQHDANCGHDNEAGDRFGFAVAVGDVAGSGSEDGFADVLIGAPFEDDEVDSETDLGMAYLFHSSATGIGDDDCPLAVLSNQAAPFDRVGGAVAIGGFDPDFAGAPVAGSAGDGPEAGSFVVFQDAGLTRPVFDQNDLEHADVESGDHFGAAFAVGDFDGDGESDLAVGAPDDDVDGASSAGEIGVFYGTDSGLASIGQSAFNSNLPASMPDSSNSFDFFGGALAAGDFDGNGVDDLAIGVPGEDLGSAESAGMVTVLYGLDRELNAFGTVQFADNAVTVSESADLEIFFVTREGGAVLAASVDHDRTGGTAAPGTDFTYSSGSESWDVGDLTQNFFLLTVEEDTLDEPNETVVISLSNPSAGTAIGTPATMTLTITDNDVAGALSFVQPVTVVQEPGGLVQIPVQRTGGAASGVTVQFATADNTAQAGLDYVASSGTLTFAANETTRFISVQLLDDDDAESAEVFHLTLSNPGGGGTLGTFTLNQIVIVDNDIFHDGFESGNTTAWSSTVP